MGYPQYPRMMGEGGKKKKKVKTWMDESINWEDRTKANKGFKKMWKDDPRFDYWKGSDK